ncbi:MAG: hypothetical protein IT370_24590 [Deltaproteobacteria bacterium]|nr:hypothetical protein [Deltaproteobacteria bacterium]
MRALVLACCLLALPGCGGDDDAATGACSPACGPGTFCDQPSCFGPGTCVAIPVICTREFAPVCGCDNQTYGNDCNRRMKGLSKAHDGECLVRDSP